MTINNHKCLDSLEKIALKNNLDMATVLWNRNATSEYRTVERKAAILSLSKRYKEITGIEYVFDEKHFRYDDL